MTIQKQIMQVRKLANELASMIEDELWDEAVILSQQWDVSIREMIRSLSAEQIIEMRSELEQIASINLSYKNQLDTLRAKTLTQINKFNNTQTAIRFYNNTL